MTANSMSLPVLSSESGLSAYIEKVNAFPYLSQDEEYMLAKRYSEHSDIAAAQELVKSHLRLVVKIAMGFRGYGLPLLELISEGNLGLMQAVKKFEPEKGFRLSTYAMWWIKASIQEYVLHSWSLVKIGTTAAQKKLFFNLRKLKSRLKKVDGYALSQDEVKFIANELDVNENDVVEMDVRMSGSDQSLNDPLMNGEEGAGEYIDFLESGEESHELVIAEKEDYQQKRQLFMAAMATLNDREKDIVARRNLSENPETLEDLSQEYSISRERVRQIEARALEKIKQYVSDN